MDVLEKARQEFFQKREALVKRHEKGETGFHVAHDLRQALDELIKKAHGEIFSNWQCPYALVALGGYGRGELNFYSDIDLNLIYDCRLSERMKKDIEEFYYFLLSLNLDLGFSPRKTSEVVPLLRSDLSILTNFLQMRFVAGDVSVFKKLKKSFSSFVRKNKQAIVEEILRARAERYKKFYGTVYYQEPNVKESKGGLRDFHEAFWISKVVFAIEDYRALLDGRILDWESFRELISAYDFLLRVRNQLHLINRRKNDILSFEYQKDVASFFGFSRDKRGVEQFMKNYFSSAIDISVITKQIINRAEESLSRKGKFHIFPQRSEVKRLSENFFSERGLLYVYPEKEKDVMKSPRAVLEAFKLVQETGLNLSASAFSLFKLSAEVSPEGFQTSEVLLKFKDILKSSKRLSYILELMHDCKVLDALIPDFARLRGHFQFDTYHKFTTDMHLILTVRELEKLREKGFDDIGESERFYRVFEDVSKPETLFIAGLLHDIGKGKSGRHENIGAILAERYMKKWGFSESEAQEVAWLVKNHLLMSHIAFRRDISDPKLIQEFAKVCQSPDRLRKLFLLTVADIKAVGPGAWDRWKSFLLWELFLSTVEVFESSKDIEEIFKKKLNSKKEKLKKHLCSKERAVKLVDQLDDYYIMTYTAEKIKNHLKMILNLSENTPIILKKEDYPELGYSEITIVNFYKRALFYRFAGLLTYLNLDIRGAYINRALRLENSDVMVYTIRVSSVSGEPVSTEKFERFKELALKVYSEDLKVEKLLKKPFKPKTFRKTTPKPETKVKIDNLSSENFTVLEVSTYDRLGVLYAITKELMKLKTRIRRALIATEGERVIDTFYITDLEGRKITSPKRLQKIEQSIKGVLSDN